MTASIVIVQVGQEDCIIHVEGPKKKKKNSTELQKNKEKKMERESRNDY